MSSTALPTAMASGLPPKVVPWAPGPKAAATLLVARQAPMREAAADALGDRHDVRRDAGPFMGEELAGAPDARLHLVEHQQQAEFVADLAEALQELDIGGAHAAFALHRLDQDRGRLRPDLGAHLVEVAEGAMVEAVDIGRIALEVFLIAGGREGRERAAMERAFEADHAVALRIAEIVLVFADQLQAAFDRLGAGIGEEDLVGEGRLGQALGELLPAPGPDRGSRCATSFCAWSVSALMRCGWEWPKAVTAMPLAKSRNRRPSAVKR